MFFFGAIFYGIYRLIESQKEKENQRRARTRGRDYERGRYRRPSAGNRTPHERSRPTARRRERPRRSTVPAKPKQNPFKISGIKKYKEYEYEAAIEDFKKALSVDPTDVAVHFNIACAYSIMEQPHLSMVHLSKAVEHGFKDFDKIKTHDALAFVRIQDGFEDFVKNGYKLVKDSKTPDENTEETGDLLEQLQKLGELREKGLLTEEEFLEQKKKLLR